MNTNALPRAAWHRLPTILASLVLGLAAIIPATAATKPEGGKRILRMTVADNGRSARVVVPDGYRRLTLLRHDRAKGWLEVESRAVKPGRVRVKLPAVKGTTRWRAVGSFAAKSGNRKFPASFYSGRSNFPARDGGPAISPRLASTADFGTAGEDAPVEPEQPDIWKIDGSTVFFFNQFRGLQVLDLTDPADPRMLASLRIPASGEDLYLLPASGPGRELVLLTRHQHNDGGVSTRIRIVSFRDGTLRVTHSREVPGEPGDSRLVGRRLVLATTEWGEESGPADTVVSSDGPVTDRRAAQTRVSEWLLDPGAAPRAGASFTLAGFSPVVSSGPGWMAVALTRENDWNRSQITVFGLTGDGLRRLNGIPLKSAGLISDKFKLQWRDHVLTTISEANKHPRRWRPVTVLENFRVWGPGVITPAVVTDPLLASLELAEGESLFATRFAGDKAYIVTFLFEDPLWIVDLRDPANPVVAGHLEVPGWSTYLEPVGDMLFSVGWESNTVAASLFDVADPAAPRLLRRLNLGEPGSFSEAAWDEKALKLLPEAGLALIPVTSYSGNGTTTASVQLLDIDTNSRDLIQRGAIPHAFDARRSTVIGDAVVSISQRVMVAADIANRDQPTVLSEVTLAWPVDRVLDAGRHLIHIEDGSAWWSNGRATARISPADDTEAILAEIDLGDGVVRDAVLRNGRLIVLRESGSGHFAYFRTAMPEPAKPGVHLDLRDASKPTALPLTGTLQARLKPGHSLNSERLLWPHPDQPAVLSQAMSYYWFGWGFTTKQSSSRDGAPRLLVFDLAGPQAPQLAAETAFGTPDTTLNGIATARDGMVVAGSSEGSRFDIYGPYRPGGWLPGAHLIEVPTAGSPLPRPVIDLPGDLFAVTSLNRDGFLAWTRQSADRKGTEFHVSASDGHDAFLVSSLMVPDAYPAATARARHLFVAGPGNIRRHTLGDDGKLSGANEFPIGFRADNLRVRRGLILASRWNALAAINPAAEPPAAATTWHFPGWGLRPQGVEVAINGDLLAPFGDFGAERLAR